MLLEKYRENSGLEEIDSDYSYYANKVYQSLCITEPYSSPLFFLINTLK